MKIEKRENYNLITVDKMPTAESLSNYQVLKNQNLVVQFSDKVNVSISEFSSVLPVAKNYKKNRLSFVIICSDVDVDKLPDELMVVTNLTEAEDIIEMEDIERNLNL